MDLLFVLPDDPASVSGGNLYNRSLIDALMRQGAAPWAWRPRSRRPLALQSGRASLSPVGCAAASCAMAYEPEIVGLSLRLPPALRAAAERAAADDRRSLASLIEMLLAAHLRATGYLPPLHADEGLPSDQLTSESDI